MRAYVMSDQHFGASADTDSNVEKYTFEYFEKFIDDINTIKDPDDICIFCGDLFDNRTLLISKVYVRVFELICKLAASIPIYIITGNHDMYDKLDNTISSINPLSIIPGVTIIKEPTMIQYGSKTLAMMPYYEYINEFVDRYKTLTDGKKIDYVFCHQDILGSCINDEAHQVPINVFKNAGKVISGHIHKRHEFKNIHFVGTPYPLTFFDSEDKGYHFIDMEKAEPNITFIKNTISPKYLTYTVSSVEDLEKIKQEEVKGNYVRLLLEKNVNPEVFKTNVISELGCYKVKTVMLKEEVFNVDAETNSEINYEELKTDISGEIKNYINSKDVAEDVKSKAMEIIIDAYNSIKRKKSNIENW